MAINREIGERPIKNITADVLKKPDEVERLFRYLDNGVKTLDQRRIAQQTTVAEGASDAATIQNLLTGINALIAALNQTSLTED